MMKLLALGLRLTEATLLRLVGGIAGIHARRPVLLPTKVGAAGVLE